METLGEQARPRAAKSPAHAAQVRMQNRRREYLERNPAYLGLLEHELADPLLYDALIRSFQTTEEREREGRTKGFSKVLEVDLLRSEAKLSRIAELSHDTTASPSDSRTSDGEVSKPKQGRQSSPFPGSKPETKEEGRREWEEFIRQRFISGQDEDFDYSRIDADDSYDVLEQRDGEESWFDDEQPVWVDETGQCKSVGDSRLLEGETGIQDF